MKKSYIPISSPDLTGNERKYVNECLSSGWISSKGTFIEKFETGFASFTGNQYAVATSNGTTALHLVLAALDINKDDEVIVPDLTFVASANCVRYQNAKVVPVDADIQSWNMDLTKIVKKISKKTKAIIAVHLYGNPLNMERLSSIAKQHNLLIIEDAAEAHGAQVKFQGKWRTVGSIGIAGCFSFYGNKIMTTGEGGMVTTDDKTLYKKMKILRDHGQHPKKRYFHEVIGYNYRMTNLQAAIGTAQLERIEEFIPKKREIASFYTHELKGIAGLTFQTVADNAKSVFWMFSILIDKPYSIKRDQLIAKLAKEGIESRPFFHPVHSLPPYKGKENYPVATYLAKHGLVLPSGSTLKIKDLKSVTAIIKKYARKI